MPIATKKKTGTIGRQITKNFKYLFISSSHLLANISAEVFRPFSGEKPAAGSAPRS
jgi:hypothetical protein